jgi:hypothetical protein
MLVCGCLANININEYAKLEELELSRKENLLLNCLPKV